MESLISFKISTNQTLKTCVLLLIFFFILGSVVPAFGLSCFRCGEYTDGVGSITPCINYTEQHHLKTCQPGAKHCVKYVSEASTVLDCAVECTEKEAWGTKVFCCDDKDGCNSGVSFTLSVVPLLCPVMLTTLRQIIL